MKYTLIYRRLVGQGMYVICHERVEVSGIEGGITLLELVGHYDAEIVFEGWPKLEGEV